MSPELLRTEELATRAQLSDRAHGELEDLANLLRC